MSFITSSSEENETKKELDKINWWDGYLEDKIENFCLQIPEKFIKDTSNLVLMYKSVPMLQEAHQLLCKRSRSPQKSKLEKSNKILESSVRMLYILLHARYIMTAEGRMQFKSIFLNKINSSIYGICPRKLCPKTPLLPIGLSESLNLYPLMGFCVSCHDVYDSVNAPNIDGAAFPPSFPHFFVITYPLTFQKYINEITVYIPSINGFGLYKKYFFPTDAPIELHKFNQLYKKHLQSFNYKFFEYSEDSPLISESSDILPRIPSMTWIRDIKSYVKQFLQIKANNQPKKKK